MAANEGGRPDWPGRGATPAPPAGASRPPPAWVDGPGSPASAPVAPTAPPPGAPPAATAPPASTVPRRPAFLRPENLKLVVAVLIGAVSVTVAVLTFRAAILAERATDKDRQAVAEAVLEQQTEANAETQLQDERSRFATFAATTVEADVLEVQAAELRAAGDDEGAAAVEDDAVEARQSAEQQDLLVGFAAYTSTDADGHPTFDVERRRADLERQGVSQNQVDSRQTVADGRDLRQQSQRLVGWVVPLVLAVVLLTLAQISRRQRPRLLLAGTAVVVWVAATGVALLGGT